MNEYGNIVLTGRARPHCVWLSNSPRGARGHTLARPLASADRPVPEPDRHTSRVSQHWVLGSTEGVGPYLPLREELRQALHARTLGFVHPVTGKEILFESPLPEDMQGVIDKWRNYINTKKE